MSQKESKWEQQFEQRFGEGNPMFLAFPEDKEVQEIRGIVKAFIREVLAQRENEIAEDVKNRLLHLANVNEVEKVDDAIKYMQRLRKSEIISESIGEIKAYQSILQILKH